MDGATTTGTVVTPEGTGELSSGADGAILGVGPEGAAVSEVGIGSWGVAALVILTTLLTLGTTTDSAGGGGAYELEGVGGGPGRVIECVTVMVMVVGAGQVALGGIMLACGAVIDSTSRCCCCFLLTKKGTYSRERRHPAQAQQPRVSWSQT